VGKGNTARERLLVYLIALVLVPLGIVGVLAAITPQTTDFGCHWIGPRLVLEGSDPYSTEEWTSATSGASRDVLGRLRTGNCGLRYGYPLTTAVALLPIALLPLEVAAAIWELGIFVGVGAGVALLAAAAGLSRFRTLVLALVVLSSQMLYLTVLNAQFGGLQMLAVGLLAVPDRGWVRSTVGLFLVALKPHVLTLTPFARATTMSRRAFVAVAVVGAAFLLASIAIQPEWIQQWTGELGGYRREMLAETLSLWTLERVMNVAGLALAVVVLTLAALAVAWWRSRPVAPLEALALVAIAWTVVVPYGLSHDHLAPIALTSTVVLRELDRRRSVPLSVAFVVIIVVMPWLLYLLKDVFPWGGGGLEVTNAIVPPAVALLLSSALLTRVASGPSQEVR
jgi:hypothetical protein